MIYEIRNYHYEPTRMTEYRAWATDRATQPRDACPTSASTSTCLAFGCQRTSLPRSTASPWTNSAPPRSPGFSAGPTSPPATNASRSCSTPTKFSLAKSVPLKAIMADNPGLENYHRMEAKFTEAL